MHSRNSTSSCLLSLTFLMRNTETPAVKQESWTRFCDKHSGVIIFSGEAQLTTVPLHHYTPPPTTTERRKSTYWLCSESEEQLPFWASHSH